MQKITKEEFEKNSYLAGANAPYIEALYEAYLKDPASVDAQWRDYFQHLSQKPGAVEVSHDQIRAQFRAAAKQAGMSAGATEQRQDNQEALDQLIDAYRRLGHINAKIDPLGSIPESDPRLQLHYYRLTEADLPLVFLTRGVLSSKKASLKAIVEALSNLYCSSVGVEYWMIENEREREWLREYIENKQSVMHCDADTKRAILKKLLASESLEKYLDRRYVGQKRFSIEGGDSLIPLLTELAKHSRQQGVEEVVIGMAHRGRLNVLLNIMGFSPKALFDEFDGKKSFGMTSSDVKYHRGYSCDMPTEAGSIHLSLAFNPSHLEFIGPVVMGSVRARQEQSDSHNKRDYALSVMIHGDAAFAGQGVVMETLNMSQTRAHCVGGSVHIILNNQVGFTTDNVHDARSTRYCSDLSKMLDVPIFHVNADDPEAVVKVTQLALDYRMMFHKDVVIDLVCYRRHGHQEVDEPTATQPMMYQIIKKHPTTKALYAKQLISEGFCTQQEVDAWVQTYRDTLDDGQQATPTLENGLSEQHAQAWARFTDSPDGGVKTGVSKAVLNALGKKLNSRPKDFKLQRQVAMMCHAREKMTAGEAALDWGYAEIMAYATLLDTGHAVRLVGEDSRRGTFFHRHSTLFNQENGEEFMPLRHLSEEQASIEIYDSILSEAAALGFEYGYSTADPRTLVIWEAQYGDFANGAQVIIDQFISSAWQKWNRLSGLVMFLPHGYEGSGPEHSSARLERYLQLCAQGNLQVCVPTSPSQIFHLLRRQALSSCRKPLIVITPKSLLRHKLATSTVEDLSKGRFKLLIPEVDSIEAEQVQRVILCSGKVYYDLLEKRREEKIQDIAIVRIEQLYPFPYDELKTILASYKKAKSVIWCQEEPKNQGAWFITRDRLLSCLSEGQALEYVGRASSAAPAAGYLALHRQEQQALIYEALNLAQA